MRGVAFDVGQTLSNAQRNRLRNTAISSGAWSYVEPASRTPTWVHFDRRERTSACSSGGYPLIRQGSRGVYVLIAQDDLNIIGFRTGGLDGVFGAQTKNAVINYQRSRGLAADGIVGCNTWLSLQEDVAEEGKDLKLVSKYGQQVWNYVTQNKASELCKNMYEDNTNYTSDLINSYAWDTTIVFIQTFGTEVKAKSYSKENNSGSLANTGMNEDEYCNIYDMSGNYREWQTETFVGDSNSCVSHGGCYRTDINRPYDYTRSRNHGSTSHSSKDNSFRSILYLNE